MAGIVLEMPGGISSKSNFRSGCDGQRGNGVTGDEMGKL